MAENYFERVVQFLPEDKKIAILNALFNVYKEAELAKLLNCDTLLIKKWSKKEKYPDNSYMTKILALAFYRSSNTSDILKETLAEFDSLCKSLGIKEATSKLDIFMKELDEKSKQIIWYLLRKGHANIRELAELINANTDNEVLVRVRELINPSAKKIFNNELLKFESSKIDPITGDKILFSWWVTENILPIDRANEMLDVFDEYSHLKVVAELQKVKEEDIKIDLGTDFITISTNSYQKHIPLFCTVKRIVEKTYRNNILELKLEKATPALRRLNDEKSKYPKKPEGMMIKNGEREKRL